MSNETQEQLKIVRQELEKIKQIDENQSKEILSVKNTTLIQSVFQFLDRTKWFLLIASLLIFLLKAGYNPAQIVEWAKEIAGSIGFGPH